MKLRNLTIICIVLLAFFTQSCTKMNDLHQKYLDEGENIYAAKVDSVAAHAGSGRLQLEIFIMSQRIETVLIFWNDYADSVEINISNQTGVFNKLIENMDEKEYIFQLISIDKYGHRSLPFEVTGNVYGNNFQSILSNRVIKRTPAIFDGILTIYWSGAADNAIRSNLVYIDVIGNQVTRKVPMSETTTVLTDFASGLKYNTLFLPQPTAIDTFYTDFKDQKVLTKIDKSVWTATADSYERTGQLPNGGPDKTIDNDPTTFWHTQHTGGNPGYPHWLAYDMKQTIIVNEVELTRRLNNVDSFSNFRIDGSMDGTNWINYGTYSLSTANGAQRFAIPDSPGMRYIRVYALSSANYYAHLAEFSVFGSYAQ